MSRPAGKPRRRKSSAAARVRRFWVLIVLALAVVSGGAAFAMLWPGFAPKNVEVRGNRVVPAAEIVARAGVAYGINMWAQNTRAMAKRVEEIPYVGSANVGRVPPSTIVVRVVERVPFAVVRSGASAALVDRDLRVLALVGAHAAAPSDLPEFVVPAGMRLEPGAFVQTGDLVRLRADYDALVGAHVVPLALSTDRYGGLVVTLRGGIRVLLGDDEDELARKVALVDPILAQVVRKERRVAEIDLRAPNTPVLVYK